MKEQRKLKNQQTYVENTFVSHTVPKTSLFLTHIFHMKFVSNEKLIYCETEDKDK